MDTPSIGSTASNQRLPTETTTFQSNFLNDHAPFQVQPALRIGQLNLSQRVAAYRRSQLGVADRSNSVRFQNARNNFITHTLSSFSSVDGSEIIYDESDPFSDYISLRDLATHQNPVGEQFISDERSVCGPNVPVSIENLGIRYAVLCDVCLENFSYNLRIAPICFFASQFRSNVDFAHIPSLCEYCPRAINPIFIGNGLRDCINEREVADLRGSQLSHLLTRQQADPNRNNMRYGPPVSSDIMMTERHLHRSVALYARLGFMEGPHRVQGVGLSPQMMDFDAHMFPEHEGPPSAPNCVNNSEGGSFYSSGESATVTRNFLDKIDNPSGLELTVGRASSTDPARGDSKMAMEKEAEEDNAGPQVKMPFTWL